jgi:D-alanyl-D-alanine carboxypeptidase/D-alanyl-D-alanine-endopeptidase (penicillin-binding protein 4)
MKSVALFGLLVPMFLGIMGQAQTLQSYCYSDPKDFKNVQGLNVDKKFPIASVSKLVTSYWALSTKGPNFIYQSVVYVTPVEKDLFDIHIQGSRDPYFGQEKLHYIISKLNEKGITKVRHLTFDENFIYLKDLDIERDPLKEKGAFPWKNYYVSQVGPTKTLAELNKGLLDGYSYSVQHMLKAQIKLLPKVTFTVSDMAFVEQKKFMPTSVTRSYALKSAPLYRLLKEMNRNSNNFAAVEIFKMLGGREKFAPFIKQQLGLGPDAIDFYEGSGNRAANEPIYNQATCRALLTIFKELTLVAQKNSLDIDDIVSVMGEEGLVNEGYPYINDANDKSGVAKTGTSAAAMTLGGMLNTKPQRMYFMYNVNPEGFTAEKKRASRLMIGTEVRKLSKTFASSLTELDHKKLTFASFDSTSFKEVMSPARLP